MYKQISSSNLFKNKVTNYLFINHIYFVCMYKQNLTLNNLQRLIGRKTQPTNEPTKFWCTFISLDKTPAWPNEFAYWYFIEES